jgi:16S rRNA (uracil1498-N3)-methyltransferase
VRRRFFVDAFAGGTAHLRGDAAHHLGRVLRAEPGQLYELSDGRSVFLARVERISDSEIDFALLEEIPHRASSIDASLLIAVTKFDRFEWALEKATELGVNRIVPLAATRSEKALLAAAEKRAARWRKILLESAQQARRLSPPFLADLARPASAFAENAGALNVILSERSGAAALQTIFAEGASKIGREAAPQIVLAIGPEGGWTDTEFESAAAANFRETSLGENILRTETAVIAGLAATHLYFDRQAELRPR